MNVGGGRPGASMVDDMSQTYSISDDQIQEQNSAAQTSLQDDFDHLGAQLARRGIAIEEITREAQIFSRNKVVICH